MKARLILDDLVPAAEAPRPLFDARDRELITTLMGAMDTINRRFGGDRAGKQGVEVAWVAPFDWRSPRYTIRLPELPVVA